MMSIASDDKKSVLKAAVQLQWVASEGDDLTAALAEFILVTNHLSIANLQYWEGLLRHPFFYLQHSSSPLENTYRPKYQEPVVVVWLDCCNSNGFKREKALKMIRGGAPSGFLFALVLRRLNDWVVEVCHAARNVIPTIAAQTKPEYVVDALWGVLPHLSSWGRLSKQERETLLSLLSLPNVSVILIQKIIQSPAGPVVSILSQMSRTTVLDAALPTIAKNAIQPAVRAKAYRCLLEKKMVWFEGRRWQWQDQYFRYGNYEPVLGTREIQPQQAFLDTLRHAAQDRSAIVRRVAGDTLFQDIGDEKLTDLVTIAELLSKDAYPSVAERGEFALKRFRKLMNA